MTAPSAMTIEPCCSERIAPIANGIQAARWVASRTAMASPRGMTGPRAAGGAARSATTVTGDAAFSVMFLYYPVDIDATITPPAAR